MSQGAVTEIAEGAISGWVASKASDAVALQVIVDGRDAFAATAVGPPSDGRIPFRIPVPRQFWDGRVRFFEVRQAGAVSPLAGGPLVFDGGIFSHAGDGKVAGRVQCDDGRFLRGFAWSPVAPGRRLEVEIWEGDRMVAAVAAAEAHPDAEGVGDGRHGFAIDLARILRGGPHDVTVHAEGSAHPLDGGRLTVGPFAKDGVVPADDYLADDKSLELLAAFPAEHLAYNGARIAEQRLAPRLVNRLRRERTALGQVSAAAALVLLGASDVKAPEAQFWQRQSYPKFSIHPRPSSPDALREIARAATYVFFARPSDQLHPSAAASVMADRTSDAVIWNRFCADEPRAGSAGLLLRRPDFDPVTWRHGTVTDTTIAVKGSVLEGCPDAVLAAVCAGRMHPLFFWLAGQELSWRTHPEALTVQVGPAAPLSAKEVEQDLPLLCDILIEEGQRYSLERTPDDDPFPYVLLPTRRASKTSVLVCFRDKAELTLRCVHSLARQHLTGELELVLVDNQSSPAEGARVVDGAMAMLGAERVVPLRYDAPFNHSAENNLAARGASGEVIVICNNDIALEDPTALEQLGAWALEDGVGAVGCRLNNQGRATGSYGHVFTPFSDDPFRAPMQESADPAYARRVHACPGVTFAFAAMARERFLAAGGLNETDFPIGYNDMEFMLRCAEAGLRHLYLGHVAATHARGSSRSGENEDRQTLLINQRYGGVISSRFRQLAQERLDFAPAKASKAAAADAGSSELGKAIKAQREVEAQRRKLAETLRTARDLSRKLSDELAAAGAAALGD